MKTHQEIVEERQLRRQSAQIIPFPVAARRGRPDNMQVWRVVRVLCPPRKKTLVNTGDNHAQKPD